MTAMALSLAQGQAQGAGSGATAALLGEFAGVQREYSKVMAVAHAVRSDLARAHASAEALKEMDRILKDEAALTVQTVTLPDGKKSRSARRSRAQEAVRAEIARDAGALLALRAATAPLAARGVPAGRLQRLKTAAEALSGRLGERTSKKGAAKGATKAEKEAVAAQSAVWSAHYRILAQAAEANEMIRSLLKDAAR